MTTWTVALSALSAGLIAASLGIAGPFDGQYSPRDPDSPGYYCSVINGGYWTIKDEYFAIEDGGCRLSNPVAVRDMDAVLYDGACNFEGEQSQRRFFIGHRRDGIIVVSSGGVYDLVRCP